MVFIKELKKITDEKYSIGYIHYMPFNKETGLGKTKEQLEQEGILIDSIPEPQQIEGLQAILYCNPSTKRLWYEYEDIPKTQEDLKEEEIKNLKQQLEQCQQSITELTALASTMLAPKE